MRNAFLSLDPLAVALVTGFSAAVTFEGNVTDKKGKCLQSGMEHVATQLGSGRPKPLLHKKKSGAHYFNDARGGELSHGEDPRWCQKGPSLTPLEQSDLFMFIPEKDQYKHTNVLQFG